MKSLDTNLEAPRSMGGPVFHIMVGCLSLAFTFLICSMETLRPTAFGFGFNVTGRTGLVFALCLGLFIPCFKIIFLSGRTNQRVASLVLVLTIGIGAFLYPLRYVPAEKFGDVIAGLGFAVFVLSMVGAMLCLARRWLEADDLRGSRLEVQGVKSFFSRHT